MERDRWAQRSFYSTGLIAAKNWKSVDPPTVYSGRYALFGEMSKALTVEEEWKLGDVVKEANAAVKQHGKELACYLKSPRPERTVARRLGSLRLEALQMEIDDSAIGSKMVERER